MTEIEEVWDEWVRERRKLRETYRKKFLKVFEDIRKGDEK